METTSTAIEYSGLDQALTAAFFVSYVVLTLVQINNLFNRRFVVFAGLLTAAVVFAQGVRLLDLTSFCADTKSSIICNNQANGLISFGMLWAYVSLAALAMFLFVQWIQRVVRR